jgi:hypothetical protein
VKNSEGKKLCQTQKHAGIVSCFLVGWDKYCVSHILASWIQTPDGRPQSPEDHKNIYSPSTPFLNIGCAQPAITSFAVQLVQQKLTQERTVAMRPSSGLHASTTAKSVEKGVTKVLKVHQPLTWHYLIQLATPKARKRKGQIVTQKYCPLEVV